MTDRLCTATLDRLPPEVSRPAYDRKRLKAGVVHIGLGAFQRAHQGPVFECLASGGDLRWGVVGASLRSPAVHAALAPQDWLYSLVVEDGRERLASVIGVLKDVIVAQERPQRLIAAISSPDTHIVTITVTEKGYKIDPLTGSLIEGDPDVRADLSDHATPRTLAGYLVAGLRRRKESGLKPLTIISCDNMRSNGDKLKASTLGIASAHGTALAKWIEHQCSFPSTMVDRIVPATRASDITRLSEELGLLDCATVRSEPFSQWVIEDRFAGERPPLERAGVQFTTNVAPWEEAKLRLLNGAHSAIAYLGGLAGLETVDAFVREPWGRSFVELLWEELRPTLQPPPQLDLGDYCASLMERFANSALQHRLAQIAVDGSQKIPQRLVPAALQRLERGESLDAIALAIAAWMRWQGGRTDAGHAFEVEDPIAPQIARCLSNARTSRDKIRALLSLSTMFPPRLKEDTCFEDVLACRFDELERLGAARAVQRFILERRMALAGGPSA